MVLSGWTGKHQETFQSKYEGFLFPQILADFYPQIFADFTPLICGKNIYFK